MEHEELFVEVVGFPLYVVSNYGRVINVDSGEDLHPYPGAKGLLQVTLYTKGNREGTKKYIHRLVAEAFFLNYSEDIEVRHINDDLEENTVLNLTLRPKHTGLREGGQSRPIRIRETNEIFISQVACARVIGGRPGAISRVLRGKRRSYLGYTFEYVEEDNAPTTRATSDTSSS